jgi:hypothetical protein
MVVRTMGKIRSFKISPRIICLLFIFLLIYIPASIIVMNRYFFLRFESRQKAEKQYTLEGLLERTKKDLQVSKQRLALLEDFIEDMNESRKEPAKSQEAAPESEKPERRDASLSVGTVRETGRNPKLVDVQEMDIALEDTVVNVDFKLVNIDPGNAAVGGYIHITMIGDLPTTPPEWSYPTSEFKNGVPINFRRGLPFIIERFKPYNHQFPLTPGRTRPTGVRIVVYNQSGTIILDKEFDLNDDS